MDYESLIKLAAKENIEVYETKLSKKLKGLYADNVIVISSKKNCRRKSLYLSWGTWSLLHYSRKYIRPN